MYVPAAVRKNAIHFFRKSLICIRPVYRLFCRGLDGNTHAPLSHWGPDLKGPSGFSDFGCALIPFHAIEVFERLVRRRSLNRRRKFRLFLIKIPARGKHTPSDPSEFVR